MMRRLMVVAIVSLVFLSSISQAVALSDGASTQSRGPSLDTRPGNGMAIPNPPENISHQAREKRFRDKYGKDWKITSDGKGVPRALHGFYKLEQKVNRPDKAESLANDFIQGNRHIFEIDPEELVLEEVREDQDLYDVRYRQDYRGIPVEGGRIRVTIGKKNMITGVGNNFYGIL